MVWPAASTSAPTRYEYGPHAFHTTDPEILADIKELMGAELIEYNRTIKNPSFLGKYFQFPLTMRDVLMRLPVQTVRARGDELRSGISAKGLFVKPEVENVGDVADAVLRPRALRDLLQVLHRQGAGAFRPDEFLAVVCARANPAPQRAGFSRQACGRRCRNGSSAASSTEGYVEKVEGQLYTTRRGFSLITQRMAERLDDAGRPRCC